MQFIWFNSNIINYFFDNSLDLYFFIITKAWIHYLISVSLVSEKFHCVISKISVDLMYLLLISINLWSILIFVKIYLYTN